MATINIFHPNCMWSPTSLSLKVSLSLFDGCGWPLFLVEAKSLNAGRREEASQSRVGEALLAQVKADRRAPHPYIRLPGARGKL